VSPGCRDGCRRESGRDRAEAVDKIDITRLGEVRIGKELVVFYIAYGFDSAVLGFSVSTDAGPARYFPMVASTDRGIPPVVLEVFASTSEQEMWVRSSWADSEILAYHRIGAETARTAWGDMGFVEVPLPDHLSGGPLPFPELPLRTAVKKATFRYDPRRAANSQRAYQRRRPRGSNR
jgi:hypothetical protein